MATHTVAKSVHGTLGAGVDTVILTNNFTTVKVYNPGTNPLYFTSGGAPAAGVTDPTLAGDDTDIVPGGQTCVIGPAKGVGRIIKLIGTSGSGYSVVAY